MKDISDGTTTTLVFSEIRTRENPRDQRGAWALPWSGTSLLSFDLHPEKDEKNKDAVFPAYAPWQNSFGFTQVPNSKNPDVLYACSDLPGEQFERMPCTAQYLGYISAAPRSNHPTGVNAVFLDGHVGFLQDNIDEHAMLSMIAPKDGETVYDR